MTQRDTSNQAFWGGKTPTSDREEGRERKRHREIYHYLVKTFTWLTKKPLCGKQKSFMWLTKKRLYD